jgi:hypothetical protein
MLRYPLPHLTSVSHSQSRMYNGRERQMIGWVLRCSRLLLTGSKREPRWRGLRDSGVRDLNRAPVRPSTSSLAMASFTMAYVCRLRPPHPWSECALRIRGFPEDSD